jgi:hypothetical protein
MAAEKGISTSQVRTKFLNCAGYSSRYLHSHAQRASSCFHRTPLLKRRFEEQRISLEPARPHGIPGFTPLYKKSIDPWTITARNTELHQRKN